jgi:hypothetical protein
MIMFGRILGALMFRKGVYGEIEKDTSFTSTAWLIVVVALLLSQLGAAVGKIDPQNFSMGGLIIGALLATIFGVVGFIVGVLVINFVGKTVFHAEVTADELVRTLGLASIWNAVGVLGLVGLISPDLMCVVSPVQIIAAILGFAAWLIATKEALDLEWLQTIVTLVIGWVINMVIVILLAGIVGGVVAVALGLSGATG